MVILPLGVIAPLFRQASI